MTFTDKEIDKISNDIVNALKGEGDLGINLPIILENPVSFTNEFGEWNISVSGGYILNINFKPLMVPETINITI